MKRILDASRMASRRAAHEYLQEQLELPEYYGKNLDALHDVLTELEEAEIAFINCPEEQTYFQKVLRVFRDAAGENPGLTLTEE